MRYGEGRVEILYKFSEEDVNDYHVNCMVSIIGTDYGYES